MFWFLARFNSIYPLEKSSPVISGWYFFFLFFFFVINSSVALDCILNGCCNLHVLFYVQALCLKKLPTFSNIENPLVIPCIMNRFISLVTSAFSCHSLSFLWAPDSIRSSWLQYVPSSIIPQSISGNSRAANMCTHAASPFAFVFWRLALASNRYNQPWPALKVIPSYSSPCFLSKSS